ncbi:efflux transporter outer membrane subunit [Formicincola oecophyllae]|uniref:Efflux transporter outer membrane subunit n=1 Tax=Formicincola oecophyllae TaxID=2558361 RepID=A0A4Y6U7Y9_9PROT|nr:efflux transporter outer membrane subunit [Formicincola oecophyllae]QDH13462.1 efflux transporter outer membrane subunit [Formicincola oecophyllae]
MNRFRTIRGRRLPRPGATHQGFSGKGQRLALLLAAFTVAPWGLAGCDMAPDYKRPAPAVPMVWPEDSGVKGDAKTAAQQAAHPHPIAANLGWEDFFKDPRLQKLIELTLHNNRSLAAQMQAVTSARGQYRVQNAALLPLISVGANAEYMDPSNTAGFSFAPGSDKAQNGRQAIPLLHYYQESIGFSSYEVDVWGRIRNLSAYQREQALSQLENLRTLWLTTVSELASDYIRWLMDREQLKLSRATAASTLETLKLTKARFDQGQENNLALSEAASSYEEAAASVPSLESAVAQDEHAIQLIVGMPLPKDLPPPLPYGQQITDSDLPAGFPSDLLVQRPDIRAAEHTLMGANAMVGAARAAFFPKFTLTANEGTSSLKFHQLFTNMAETWGISPGVNIPLLTWGVNEGNLESAKAEKRQAIANYQKAVQTAFREVSDSLTSRGAYKREEARVEAMAGHTDDAYKLSVMRYKAGIDSFLPTLVNQRSAFQSREYVIYIKGARLQNSITLYRALGGGWTKKSLPWEPQPPADSAPKQSRVEQNQPSAALPDKVSGSEMPGSLHQAARQSRHLPSPTP